MSVVVDELDIIRTSFMPGEAESPLGVDPNAVLATSIASQRCAGRVNALASADAIEIVASDD